jgi:hypothetical protein
MKSSTRFGECIIPEDLKLGEESRLMYRSVPGTDVWYAPSLRNF